MPVTYRLVEDNRVQHIVVVDPWTIDEMQAALQAMAADLELLSHIIYFLVDLRHAHRVPVGLLGQVRHIMKPGHPRRGPVVVIGGPIIFTGLIRYMTQSLKYERLQFFDTEADAWAYLHKLIADAANGSETK